MAQSAEMLCFTERARERDKSEMCVDSEHAIGTPRTFFTGMLWHMNGTYPDGGIDAQQNGDPPLQGRQVIIPAFGRNVSAPLGQLTQLSSIQSLRKGAYQIMQHAPGSIGCHTRIYGSWGVGWVYF